MKALATALGILLVSAQASAFTPKPEARALKNKLQNAPSAQAKCTDFTGTWKGVCVASTGEKENAEVTIVQEACNYLLVDNQFIAIGGTRSEAHAIPLEGGDLHSAATTNMTWNQEKSALYYTTHAAVYQTGVGTIYNDKIAGAVALKGGKLVSYAKATNVQYACEYAKSAK